MQKILTSLTFIAASLPMAAQPYAYSANYYSNPGIISVINTATNAVTTAATLIAAANQIIALL